MIPATKEQFLASLKPGDFGVILSGNFFATLQNWYRRKFKEGGLAASHAFYIHNPPGITEANGAFVRNDATIVKNIGDSTKCWAFRYSKLTPDQLSEMNASARMAVDVGGHYSVGGILQFAMQYLGMRKAVKDESGVFCSEFDGDVATSGNLPWVPDEPVFAVTPSRELNWLMSDDAKAKGWVWAGFYDGAGHYLIDNGITFPKAA